MAEKVPDPPEATEPLTRAKIKQLQWTLMLHLNLGSDGHVYQYRCVQYPEITITDVPVGPKKERKRKKSVFVNNEEVKWGDLDRLCYVVNKRRGFPVEEPPEETNDGDQPHGRKEAVEPVRTGGQPAKPDHNGEEPDA